MESRISGYERICSGSGPASARHIAIKIREMTNDLSDPCKEQPSDRPPIPCPRMRNEGERHLFEPQYIRIGPYHPRESYSGTVKLKLGFLKSLCSRSREKDLVNLCTDEMHRVAGSVMSLYDQNAVAVVEEEFVERLVIDGCFVVEYLHQRKEYFQGNPGHDLLNDKEHLIPLIDYDLLLLINQIPLFLLDKINLLAFPRVDDFTYTAFSFVSSILKSHTNFDAGVHEACILTEAHHFLDLYRNISIKNMDLGTAGSNPSKPTGMLIDFYHFISHLPTATFLHESRIELKKLESKSVLSIQFKHGALSIPFLIIKPSTLSLLKNLFEMEKYAPVQAKNLPSRHMFSSWITSSIPKMTLQYSNENALSTAHMLVMKRLQIESMNLWVGNHQLSNIIT